LTCISNLAATNGLGSQLMSLASLQSALSFLATDPRATVFLNNFLSPLGFSQADIQTIIQQTLIAPPALPDMSALNSLNIVAKGLADTGSAASPVPEPSSFGLVLLGSAFLRLERDAVAKRRG